MIYIVFACFLLICSGCAIKMSPSAAKIQESDMAFILKSNCEYIAEVHGTSGWGNLAASQGIENAKIEAKEKAVNTGATHIVWSSMVGGYSPFVIGKAYFCK